MIHRCAFVGTAFVCAAFSIVGVDAFPAIDATEAREKIEAILENTKIMGEPYGLILVEGACWEAFDPQTRDAFSAEQKPVVVPVDLTGPAQEAK